MTAAARIRKGLRLLANRRFAAAAFRHRVAAAVEHLDVIRHTAAGMLIDVGANKGQFSLAFRHVRPQARILAFEPLPDAGDMFEQVFKNDPQVILHRVALSDVAGRATFHVTDRPDSSSLLRPGVGQSSAFHVGEERQIEVPLRRLDSFLPLAGTGPVLMKIDVQGAELLVLQGCGSLDFVDTIYVELSFVELYEGQPLFGDVTDYLRGRGFTLAGIFNQAWTQQFGPTQADCLFRRTA